MRYVLILLISLSAVSAQAENAPIRLLVITGGHPFDPRFYSLFENQDNIEWDKKTQTSKPCAAYTPGFADGYDVVLLYDFVSSITDAQKQAFEGAFGEGRGLIVMHHALCDHPAWPKFREISGGQFLFEARDGLPKSEFTGGVHMTYEPAEKDNPITLGIDKIEVVEEPYKHVFMSTEVKPLLLSNNPESDHVVGWTKDYKKSRVVAWVPGHGGDIFVDPNYRKFVNQAIHWAAHREVAEKK